MSISAMLFPGELLPDTEWGLVAKAFEKNYSVIASYSAIPASTRVSLEIQEHGEAPGAPGLGRMGGGSHRPHSAPPPISLARRGDQEGTRNTHHPGPHRQLAAPHAAIHAPSLEVHG